jgi:hypothetical protein
MDIASGHVSRGREVRNLPGDSPLSSSSTLENLEGKEDRDVCGRFVESLRACEAAVRNFSQSVCPRFNCAL